MKTSNKLTLAILSIYFSISFVNAQTTVCYKNNWNSPSTIENTPLNGDVCENKYSLNDMKKMGWNVVDIKMDSNQNKLNYKYFLIKDVVETENKETTKTVSSNSKFTIKPIGIKLENIQNNKSNINIGNLTLGSSGILVHIYDNDRKIIVSNAKVIESNDKNSIVEFFSFDDLKQDALPTSNKKPQIGDILVLNYMYQSSLLIAPTQNIFQKIRAGFKYNNFIHSDIFATELKIESQPYPTKKDIQKFAIEQNIGTIFIVVNQEVYILDAKTFEVLTSYDISYEQKDFDMPFYSRIENIEESIFSFNTSIPFINEERPTTYEEYYTKLLGL